MKAARRIGNFTCRPKCDIFDGMDIGSVSYDIGNSSLLEDVSIAIQAHNLEAARAQGEAVLKLMDSVPLPEGSGTQVNTTA
jgi:hypothetical protein